MNDVSVVGGKAAGLAKLVMYGCPVPDFFVITAGSLNDEFAAELEAFAAHLHCDVFSVRSSNVHEDGAANSFAGQYLTLLNVKKEDLFAAVKKVALSARGQTANSYAEHFNVCASDMAIIVQRQICGAQSGVLFTQSPTSGDEIIIESVDGTGDALVSGTVTPRKTIIKKREVQYAEDYQSQLVRTAIDLEKREGYPLDIEWTFADKLYFLQMRPITVIGDSLPAIPDKKWNLYVYRDFCVLAHSVQRRAAERDIQERIFGFSIPVYEGLLVNGREFYSDENDRLTIEKWSAYDRENFFENYIAAIKKLVLRTNRRATSLKNKSFCGYDNASLFAAYRRAINAYIESYVPLMMRPDDYLILKYQSLAGELSAETADIITPVWEKTAYSAEKEDFLLAKISKNTASYLEKYAWINNPLGKRIAHMTETDVEKRLKRLTVRQAEESLAQLKYMRAQKKLRFNDYLNKIDNEEEKRLLRLISEFIRLRTYTSENSDRLFYYIREKLIFEIADRFNIPHEQILCMTYREISALERGEKISKSEIAKRRSGELITFSENESRSYYGNTVSALLGKLLPHKKGEDILSGDIACAGEVRGRIKIVRNFNEADKVQDGDIIVTSMTTPEIVCALEKAGGIITDEGGITCHAAIIAREYGIPCLVGTKCATSVLKDGMQVYLDCLNGFVEIISDN